MVRPFVHLRLHTEYSIVDGLVRIPDLVRRAAALGMPALAVTDQGSLFSMVKFYRAAETQGVKPLIGADLWLQRDEGFGRRSRLVLLCQDPGGYRNLSRLITRSYFEGQSEGVPQLRREWLDGCAAGLIALSGGREGDVGQALLQGADDQAAQLLDDWQRLFGDRYYLELQRTGRPGEEPYIAGAVDLAARAGVPVVATNDVRFLAEEDFEAHEARVCIHEGRTLADPRRPRRYSAQQYLRSAEEMAALFADLPEALDNSVLIAERCNLEFSFGRYFLPDFPVPEGRGIEDWFQEQSRAGLERRLAAVPGGVAADRRRDYEARLAREQDVITRMGFAGYFLIVADFIRWARDNGIPVGPGRGSGAGSLAAYCLGITDLDPLQYDLLFERFLNPERVSMPDFDVDFCMDRRDEVIEYVARRYGQDRVCQIITYGSMAAKAVVRDVGRVLGHPYGFVDQIAKLIPFELNMTLERALAEEEALRSRYEQEEEVRALIDLACKLEGLTRNAGRHAGGVVIAPTPLTDFMPLYREQGGSSTVTQLDMGDVEAVGLVKFDFLGLRTLTIIDWAVRDINRMRAAAGEPALDIAAIALDDAASFALVQRAETTAVFQLESRGMKELITRLKPDSFEDMVALVALFRPGPLQSGMVDDFIARKHGRARVEYPHPDLEPILKPTYGVILYQEQVMQIAQVLAGYTLGAADLLRRAMGKKKPEEMAKQRAIFTRGAQERGVAEATASYIFDLMEKFAGYGFNKSHSAAYALVAYQTAWLKAHYPAAFMAAVLSADMDHTDKVVALIDECRRMQLAISPPHVNHCEYRFSVAADDQGVRYGLGAIKGLGANAVECIVEARLQDGPFQDLFDLCRRVDLRRVNRRALEALIRAGALDGLGASRGVLMASLDQALQLADQRQRARAVGQNDLFGFVETAVDGPAGRYVEAPDWSPEERLAGEKETLGLYLTGHPIERYTAELERMVSCRLADLRPDRKRSVVVAGLVVGLRSNASRRGRMAFVTLDDRSARVELTVYSEAFQRYGELLRKDNVLVVEGSCSVDEFTGRSAITAERIYDMEGARAAFARGLVVSVSAEGAGNGFVAGLRSILDPYREGHCPVAIDYHHPRARARLNLGLGWKVRLPDALLERLRASFGDDAVRVEY